MKTDATLHFGEYLHGLRHERKLGVRELARRSGIDAGGLTRLERGKITPQPDTLKALGAALDVPFADLFAMAGYVTPSDLPSMSTYLRTRYGLPEDAIASVDEYIQQLIGEQGLDPNGPMPLEDEIEKPPGR
ncbi:helix-turn-helix transcriptional regulator [Streptomyces sp. LBUM 1478]|uniref:HTH cro/C1-type domain-containing protein n=1 Tax=Streptomyces scabiei (strain 87.22) TaxID=680198 RepID=C9Z8H4_STRSW|nr:MULTISPECIES: helix-turn-helix transcriptional regulator [Streptomyces]MBP5867902.1 helix-turn-helix transcriptional regulator [Streptomyces sp. LBUM 1485]MBP5906434.1 helix-turn-helix transcriptional regulator [Streptomyces sp. LBUM 1478]MBP5930897.1 helix-turn-helix transcriptional regulator [Streptomyces sp. LBUM 1479]MBP5916289.1 helix-turn-helix transcriptional regulator [Streptomyces sp. LBUM 1486]MDX2536795.1 helix-turn-helix transcriptional regulator [Streptomyces scabiei]